MKTLKALLVLGTAATCFGANLQPQDLLFISTHRRPTQVVSDDKVAYVLTEGGVLMYDYRKQQWMDNIAPGMGVVNIAYNPSRSQLLMAAGGGAILEYNPAFRRVSNSSSAFAGTATGTVAGDLNGLTLGSDYTLISDASASAIRDRYNRRAVVTTTGVFDYDHLWVLTAGHGAFLGSLRRKEAAPNWFGLYDSSVTSVYSDGQNLWFGSSNVAGALVSAKTDLSDWHVYASQQDYDFIDGSINDMVVWRDYLWIATGKGVVRQDLKSKQFSLYRRMQGSTDIAIYRLFVHQDQLYAGTANGVAVLDAPESKFHNSELPISITIAGHDFCSKGKDLWAATSMGLYVLQPTGWKSIKDVTKQDVPEAYASDVPSVGYCDSSLFWAASDRVFEKAYKQPARSLFSLGGNIFRIRFDGDNLFADFDGGVRVYNLKSRLWVDFLLADGIPGHKVQTFFVNDGLLWIGTDLGAMRLKLKSYLP